VALGGDDASLFHAEWSAMEGCELDDELEWCRANPSIGYGLTLESIRSDLLTDPANVFRTEVLCQAVDILNTALDVSAWRSCADPVGKGATGPMALCVAVALDGERVVATSAAPLSDGRIRLDVVGMWDSTEAARVGVPALRSQLRPTAVAWYPKGPGAALSAPLRKLEAVEIKGLAVSEAHMALADRVEGRRVVHGDHPVLNESAQKTGTVGSAAAWTFDQAEDTHGLWAAAGALHLALNMPAPVRRRRRVLVLGDEPESG
jgi:hypothetical protein